MLNLIKLNWFIYYFNESCLFNYCLRITFTVLKICKYILRKILFYLIQK